MNESPTPESLGMIPIKGGFQYPERLDPKDVQRDEFIRSRCQKAAELYAALCTFKQETETEFSAHVALVNDTDEPSPQDLSGVYDTLDGTLLMEVDYAPVYRATEAMVELKRLLRQALDELGDTIDASSIKIVKSVLRIEGRSVDLKQLDRLRHIASLMTSPSWREAVELLPSCTVLDGYHPYYRFFSVDEEGVRTPIMRNFSAIRTGVHHE